MAAQDAELQLKVSLDLAFFRQQLATLGSAAAGYQLPVNLKFDRTSLTKQLTLLSNSLGRKKYDVEVKSTSLEALLKQVDTFKQTLATLKKEDISLDVKVEADISKTKANEARRDIINAITGGPGKAVVVPTAIKNPLVGNIDEVRAGIKKKLGIIEVDVKASLAGGASDSDAIKKKILGETEAIAIPLRTVSPNRDNIRAIRADIKEKLSGIKIQVQAELSSATAKSTGEAKSPENYSQAQLRKLGQDIKPLYRAAADAGLVEFNAAIKNNVQAIAKELSEISKDAIAGLLNGLKSGEPQIQAAAKSLGQALIASIKNILGIASPSKVFKAIGEDIGEGFELGAVGSMDKAFDALEKKLQERLKRLQSILSLAPSRRSAFPFIATGGALESGPIAREIDQAYAKIAQIQERRQERLTTERGSLAQMAGRLLPPARDRSLPAARETILPGGGALDQVTQGFIQSLKNTRDTLARNFSANTYLPRATRALATSMDAATKQLSGTKIAGLLPSKEMMEPLRFQRAQQKAAQIDAENIAKAQAEQALNQQNLRGMFKGLSPISAPMIGAENIPLSKAAQYSLNKANRLLGLPMGPSSPLGSMGQFPMAAMIGRGSLGRFPIDGPLAIGGPSAMGQSVAGPTPWLNTSRGALGGFSRGVRSSAVFPMAGMMWPSSPLGRITAQSSMFGGGGMQPPGGGGGGGGRFGGFGDAMGFGSTPSPIDLSVFQQARLPLTGAIAELTSEFANATKQVLLFGTAYKALAFFINLPGEAFEAAKALATYKNQLQAVTSESNTFEQSFAFVDNLAQRFNVPLESARQGFVKLYASMQPAGFGQGQIENLFEGISKATAAFGLSADKVDRVNYAFAQMASKGQIMSEELKGQLGDVLPGALALFAQAAQMSIPEFSKAMEDGAFKGKAMMQVLDNVAVLMNSKFGPAAQNASKTLQGALNEMQNNLKVMYESLSPFVDQFAAAFGPQINSLIGDVTSAVKALTGTFTSNSDVLSTLSPRAEALYNTFQLIGPSVTNAAKNIGNFASSLQVLVGPLFTITKGLFDFISLPVVARVGLYATIIASLNAAFQLLARTGILQATVAMVRFLATLNIAQINVYIAGIRTVVAVLGSMVTATNLAKVAMMGLKVVMGGLVVGAIMVGLDMLAQRLLNIGDAANKSKANVRELLQDLDRMAGSADIAGLTEKYMQANTELAIARKKYENAEKDLRLTKMMPVDQGGSIVDVANAERKASEAYQAVINATTRLRQVRQSRDLATKRKLEEDLKTQQQLQPIDLSAGESKTKAVAAQSLESLESLRDQLAKARMEGDMERAKILFEYQKRLDERRFELQESGANDIQKAGIKLAKELFDVKMRLEEQIFNAGQSIVKEAGSVAPGNRPPRAPKGQGPYGPITQFGAGANANLQIGQQVGGADMQRPVSGSERRDIVAAEKTAQATKTANLQLTVALKNAEADYAQVIRQNFDTIFPVAQLQLQNQLLATRYQLELQAVPQEAIDAQMAITEARAKGVEMQKKLDDELAEAIKVFDKYKAMQKDGIELNATQTLELQKAEIVINAYSASVGEAAGKVKEFTIAQLENAVATMKQADALKALEEVSNRINQAVEGVTGTYKDLFKEIAMGGDSVEALKKAQEALADQVLTMFFDFAMQPVEKFFKDQLGAIFGIPNEEEKRKEQLTAMEKQLEELKASRETQQKIQDDTAAIRNGTGGQGGADQSSVNPLPGISAIGGDASYSEGAIMQLPEITGSLNESANAYADALSKADASVWYTASSVSDAASQMDKAGPVGSQWQKALGGVVQGLGMAVGAVMGIVGGINQLKEGGTSNVLGGIGAIMTSVGGLLGGLSGLGGLFGGSAGQFGTSAAFNGTADALGAAPFAPKISGVFANGGIASGGFQAFANGGMVTGPTLGLVGEGLYNEAIVPLPDGKSIPVQFNGGAGLPFQRGAQQGQATEASSSFNEMRNIAIPFAKTTERLMTERSERETIAAINSPQPINIRYESNVINGVEYVTAEQHQRGMSQAAEQGRALALSALQNSVKAKRKVGMV